MHIHTYNKNYRAIPFQTKHSALFGAVIYLLFCDVVVYNTEQKHIEMKATIFVYYICSTCVIMIQNA